MGIKFKSGDQVRQVVKPVEGRVVGSEIVGDEIQVRVEWFEGEERHERMFSESDLEAKE